MRLLDNVRLLVGMPLTSSDDRTFSATCVAEAETFHDEQSGIRNRRLEYQQAEHDAGRLDLKGAGEAFSLTPEPVTVASMQAEIAKLERSIPILQRRNHEECTQARTTAKERCRTAKTLYQGTLVQAKTSHTKAIAHLLPVEKQARDLADTTYNQVVGAASKQYQDTLTAAASDLETFIKDHDSALAAKIASLRKRSSELRQEILALPLDRQFKRIDMGFLSMRKKSGSDAGLPLFAVFTDKQPEFQISLRITKPERTNDYTHRLTVSNKTVAEFFNGFAPVLERGCTAYVRKHWYNEPYYYKVDLTGTVTAKFAGIIPQPVREKIHKARPHFDEILIVTEAPEWKYSFKDKSFIPVPVGDPLVIGAKGGLFWLIDVFDTTPAEDHVRREFTSDIQK